MIIVSIDETAEGYGIKCDGESVHSGHDILRAGVSAMCKELRSLTEKKEIGGVRISEKKKPGNVGKHERLRTAEKIGHCEFEIQVDVFPGNCIGDPMAAAFEAIRNEMLKVEKQYPEYIKVISEI